MTKPVILEPGYSQEDLENFKQSNKIWKIVDSFGSQLEELFDVENPGTKHKEGYQEKLSKFIQEKNPEVEGRWVYYPWNGVFAHILAEEDFIKVRTNRNKNIINAAEQEQLAGFNVAVIGLSIGGGMAVNLAYSGISKHIKIADFDTLSLSNLNRIRAGVQYLDDHKIDITSQHIYEINPYAQVEAFEQGVSSENIKGFLENPKPGLIFEAIDDFEMKIRTRLVAKQLGIPVIMLTNLGDRLMIDVERYDQEPDLEIFNGLIGSTGEDILNNPITEADKQKYAVAIVGKDNIPQRVMETIFEINKTLVGRPQVMSTVTIGSGVASYLARRIALGMELNSGRTILDFEKLVTLQK